MSVGTSLHLASGIVLKSNPTTKYKVKGDGWWPASEIRVGESIIYRHKPEVVVAAITWRIPEYKEAYTCRQSR
jgi:hypothetical protein